MSSDQFYQQCSYESSYGAKDDGLAFQDFLPNCQTLHGIFSKDEYDNFRILLDRANDWLRAHPEVEIKTCETIEFKTKHNEIYTENMIYLEEGRFYKWFVRGLRLWYRHCKTGEKRIKQVGYRNIVPELKDAGGMLSFATYEDLDEVILKYNNALRTDPIPGRIITIETQAMRVGSNGEIDPDCSNWREGGAAIIEFLFILRIYFEVTDPQYEEIGVTDFIPDCTSKSCIAYCRKFESCSDVSDRAFDWCLQKSDLRICNFQSLNIKLHETLLGRGPKTDSKKMSFMELLTAATFYIRILRVGHVKQQVDNCSELAHSSRFTSKCFVPVLLKSKRCEFCCITNSTMPEFETLQETQKRISTWLNATGAEVFNAETLAVRLNSEGAHYSSELSFSLNPQAQNEYWFYAVRLYLTGSYSEPSEDKLLPVPEVQREGCTIL